MNIKIINHGNFLQKVQGHECNEQKWTILKGKLEWTTYIMARKWAVTWNLLKIRHLHCHFWINTSLFQALFRNFSNLLRWISDPFQASFRLIFVSCFLLGCVTYFHKITKFPKESYLTSTYFTQIIHQGDDKILDYLLSSRPVYV